MNLTARKFTIPEFQTFVDHVNFNGWLPKFAVVHNTSTPNQKLYREWHSRANWSPDQWLKNLASYYTGLGWNGCPHLFVAYDYIMVLNSLNYRGTHTPSWNSVSWGVETVGDWEYEKPDVDTYKNVVAALGILHDRIGIMPDDYKLGVRGLHYHKEDKATTHKTCPGKNLVKETLVDDVLKYMGVGDIPIGANYKAMHDISIASQTADTTKLSFEEATSAVWLQKQLVEAGFKLMIDGIIGNETKTAVRSYQAKKNLTIDGIAGPLTRLSLKKD